MGGRHLATLKGMVLSLTPSEHASIACYVMGYLIGVLGCGLGKWNICGVSGKGGEVCEEPRKRMIDVCCLLEMRWRGQGARMLGTKGRR